MRYFFSLPLMSASLGLLSLGFSVPAAAQDAAPETEIIEKLNDPVFQDNMADMVGDLMTAMMNIPIGQVITGVEQAIPENMRGDGDFSDIDPDATIADLAGRDNPNFQQDMDRNVRKGTKMMGIMASEFGALLPQLKAMGEKMKRRMDDLE